MLCIMDESLRLVQARFDRIKSESRIGVSCRWQVDILGTFMKTRILLGIAGTVLLTAGAILLHTYTTVDCRLSH